MLQLCSLELRRLQFELFMCYRIIFGLVNVCVSDFFELNCASLTRGHPYTNCTNHARILTILFELPTSVFAL